MRILFYALLLLTVVACSPKYPVVFVEPDTGQDIEYQDGLVYAVSTDSTSRAEVAFVTDAAAYLIFEMTMYNHSDSMMYLSHDHFQLDVKPVLDDPMIRQRNQDLPRSELLEAIDPIEQIEYLESIQQEEEKAKETNTVWATIITGVEVVAAAVTPGVGLATGVAIAADNSVDIISARENSNYVIASIEDEIEYMADRVLDETRIPPHEQATFDILFERVPFVSDLELIARFDNHIHTFDYDLRIEMR